MPEKKYDDLESVGLESMERTLRILNSLKLEPGGTESWRSAPRKQNLNRPSTMMRESRKSEMKPGIRRPHLGGQNDGGHGRLESRKPDSRRTDSRPSEPMKSESRRPISSRPARVRQGYWGPELKEPELKQPELKKSASNIQPKQEDKPKNLGHTSAGKKIFRSKFREEL